MDYLHLSEILPFLKAASPWGAAVVIMLGLFRLIRDLRQTRNLADAVKTMSTQKDRDTLVELYRIDQTTLVAAKPASRRKLRP